MLKNTFLHSYRRIMALITLTCLTALCFTGCVMNCFKKDGDTITNESNEELSDIIWYPATPYMKLDLDTTPVLWNDTKVSDVLKSKLIEARPSDRFAIWIKVNTDDVSERYVYDGVTYGDYLSQREAQDYLYYQLRSLSKNGQYLKYGKDIYLTGTPDGIIWTEEYYNDRVAYYGSALLDKYIVDSVFLEEKVLEDMLAAQNEYKRINELLPVITTTFRETITNDIANTLRGLGFECTNGYKTISLIITKEDFASLMFDEKTRCTFFLATHPDDAPRAVDD